MKRRLEVTHFSRILLGLLILAVCLLWASTNAEAGLRAYWAMDEGTGIYAMDSSGNSNHGQLFADIEAGDPASPLPGTSTVPDWITGASGSGYALQFCAGTDNYNHVAVLKSDTLTDLGQAFSFAMWIRQDSLDGSPGGGSGYARVISTPNYEIELGTAGWSYDYFWPYGTPSMQTDIGSSYYGLGGPLGTWQHMVVTYDGTDLKKYLNGQLVPDSVKNLPGLTLTDVWSDPSWEQNPLKLGCQVWPNKDWLRGALDDVAIWGNAYLDASAAADLYNGTATPANVSYVQVPEPTTALLAAAACMCMVSARRRRIG